MVAVAVAVNDPNLPCVDGIDRHDSAHVSSVMPDQFAPGAIVSDAAVLRLQSEDKQT
jgi:hypothetical protein